MRIEDTDTKRSTDLAINAINDGLDWLGLNSDEPIIMQSKRIDRHKEIANTLLEKECAYKCFLTKEEQDQIRSESFEKGMPFRSPWRDKKINSDEETSV